MMMMIVIYFIITVVNWAFHYYCYYYIIFLSLLNIQYFFVVVANLSYNIHIAFTRAFYFKQKRNRKKVFCMDIEKNHQRQVEYTIITWDMNILLSFLHGPYYEPFAASSCFRCLLDYHRNALVLLTCAHFYVRKLQKEKGGSTCNFFSFHYI